MPIYRFKWGDFVLLVTPVGVVVVDMQDSHQVRMDSHQVRVHMLGGRDQAVVLTGESARAIRADMVQAHGMAEAQKQGIEEMFANMDVGGKGGPQ